MQIKMIKSIPSQPSIPSSNSVGWRDRCQVLDRLNRASDNSEKYLGWSRWYRLVVVEPWPYDYIYIYTSVKHVDIHIHRYTYVYIYIWCHVRIRYIPGRWVPREKVLRRFFPQIIDRASWIHKSSTSNWYQSTFNWFFFSTWQKSQD